MHAFLFLLTLATATPAATAPPSPGPAFTDHLTVTATGDERPSAEVPASVTVLDATALEQSASATLDDTLRQVPGFSLFRRSSSRNAHPTTQGASLRGIAPSGTSRVLVLLDGVPVNDPFGGWVSWSRLPRASVERVEVARGVGAELWGSGALAGVVHLVTAPSRFGGIGGRANASHGGRLRAELGERDEQHFEIAAGRAGETWSLLADARLFASDGFHVVPAGQRGTIDIPASTEQAALYARARRALGTSSGPADDTTGNLELRLSLFDEDHGNGTPLTNNGTRGGYLTFAWDDLGPSGAWRASLTSYLQDFQSTFSAQATDRASERPALDQFDVDAEAWRAELTWRREVGSQGTGRQGAGRHRLSAGVEARGAKASTAEDFFFSGTVEDGRFQRRRRAGGERRLFGFFVQDEIQLGAHATLTLGARVDRWEAHDGFRREAVLEPGDAPGDGVPGETLRDDAFIDRDETTLSPRLGVTVRPGESSRWTFHGAIYRGFRAPTINELYRPFRVRSDITAANPELGPETAWGTELGAAWRGAGLDLRLALFESRLDDAVANLTLGPGPGVVGPCGFVPGGGVCRQRRPLEESRVRGLEAGLAWRPSGFAGWTFSASYLLSDTEVRRAELAPELVGKRLAQVPRQQAVVAVGRMPTPGALGGVGGRLQLRWADEQFEDDLNQRPLASFALLDLTLRRHLGAHERGVELFAAVENLLDREVEVGVSAEGLLTLGAPRLVRGGVRWGW